MKVLGILAVSSFFLTLTSSIVFGKSPARSSQDDAQRKPMREENEWEKMINHKNEHLEELKRRRQGDESAPKDQTKQRAEQQRPADINAISGDVGSMDSD